MLMKILFLMVIKTKAQVVKDLHAKTGQQIEKKE
jgi:hypothetical protein